MPALAGQARRWEPKRARLRVADTVAGRLASSTAAAAPSRRTMAIANDITAAIARLKALPAG